MEKEKNSNKNGKIFRDDVVFEVKKIDFNDPKVRERIDKINAKQEEILNRKCRVE